MMQWTKLILPGVLIVILPILLGVALVSILPSMPQWAYMIVGYVALMVIDFLLIQGMLHLPLPLSVGISVILPFLQASFAVLGAGIKGDG